MSEMLFANLDVSTHVLTSLIALLGEHQEVQDKLRLEIQQTGDNVDNYCNRKDSLLRYCLLESLRLRPFTSQHAPSIYSSRVGQSY